MTIESGILELLLLKEQSLLYFNVFGFYHGKCCR